MNLSRIWTLICVAKPSGDFLEPYKVNGSSCRSLNLYRPRAWSLDPYRLKITPESKARDRPDLSVRNPIAALWPRLKGMSFGLHLDRVGYRLRRKRYARSSGAVSFSSTK